MSNPRPYDAKRTIYDIVAAADAGGGIAALKFLLLVMAGLSIGAAPALAEVEQCRFIQAKAEREACYERQEAALAAKRKPEPAPDVTALDSLQQMRREDDALYRSMRGICRGC
jgi:hypothetical protein